MLNIYRTENGVLRELTGFTPGCWINMVNPTAEEMEIVHSELNIESEFLRAALDEEESSRLEQEDDQTLVIIDVPLAENDKESILYSTMPLSIIVTPAYTITVSLRPVATLEEIAGGLVRDFDTTQKTRFLLKILLRIATRYLQYLKKIDKMSSFIERQLYKSQRNKELIQLLGLEKSLVYFTTSLKSAEAVVNKLSRGRSIPLTEDDAELLEDVFVEFHQANEMANIYSSILSGTMDAFASVISNNLNVIMKVLTSLTIIMTIPNIVFGFYGMNVGLPLDASWIVPAGIAVVLMATVGLVLKKKDLF